MDKFFKPRSVTKAGKDVDDDPPEEMTSNVYNDQATVSSPNVDDPVLTAVIPSMLWPGIEKFFVCKGSKGNNLLVHCVLCEPSTKLHSVSKTTPSNLKRHINRVHQYKNNDFEIALNDGKQNVIKKQCFGLETDQTTKPLHQLTLEHCGSGKEGVTQHKLNDLLLKFIVSNTQPLSVVYIPHIKVMSSKNLKLQIEKLYLSMVDNITDTLSSVLYVSTTAGCWTKGKKSYIGVTCHWINSKSFKRESVSLACYHIKGHHTYDVIAKEIYKMHTTYKIQNKIVSTTTDNGSNFVKAFNTYSKTNNVDLFDILNLTSTLEQESDTFIQLPPHYRCVSHTLDLIAKSDVEKMIITNSDFKKFYRKMLGKCSAMWSKQNMSPLVAEKIHDTLGVYFKTPNKTRWNCMYDALLLFKKNIKCTKWIRHDQSEIQLMNEYNEVMLPLADTLDFLQGEESMYMGFLLPSLHALEKKLKAIENEKLVYSSCLMPRFKLIWLDRYDQCLAGGNLKALFYSTEIDENDTSDTTDEQFDKAQNFFCLPLNNQPKSSSPDELKMYLKSPLTEITMLLSYPEVMEVFLKYNTPMPSSAPVERLFSTGSNIMTVKHYRLGDELFEKLVLKQNKITI
ncbi:hypothetical protein QTP88_008419 [Uroleucon formosanum]